MVPEAGIQPASPKASMFKTDVFSDFTTPGYMAALGRVQLPQDALEEHSSMQLRYRAIFGAGAQNQTVIPSLQVKNSIIELLRLELLSKGYPLQYPTYC